MKIAITSDIHLGDRTSKLAPHPISGYKNHYTFNKFINLLYNFPTKGPIDYLILNGDILDFSINSFEGSCKIAKEFFRALAQKKIVKQIIYIPGNHDKYIWDAVEWEVNIIRKLKKHKDPRPFKGTQPGIIDFSRKTNNKNTITLELPSVSYVEKKQRYGDLFLEGLFTSKNILPINIVYPNLYIKTHENTYIITHGHMFEFAWVLLSDLLQGWNYKDNISIEELEEYNRPITSMICTGIGQGGDISKLFYEIMQEIKKKRGIPKLKETVAYAMSRLNQCYDLDWYLRFEKINTYLIMKIVKSFINKYNNPRNDTEYCDRIMKDTYKRNRFLQFYYISTEQAKSLGLPIPNNIIFGHTHVPIKEEPLIINDIHLHIHNTGGWLGDSSKDAEIFFFNEYGQLKHTNINNNCY